MRVQCSFSLDFALDWAQTPFAAPVIDEVQRIPELLNEVHDLIESKRHAFILTGASARKLRRDGVNPLAGRALTYHMHPLTVAEQADAYHLESSLQYGHLPARFSEPDPAKYLKDYVQTYLREEVMQEGLTRNIGHFSRFLEVASFPQGSLINVSEVARDAHIQRTVAESYFSIVEASASDCPCFPGGRTGSS